MRSLLFLATLLVAAAPAFAQNARGLDTKPYTPPDDEAAAVADANANVALAFRLATYGRENGDAEALLTAARILIATPYEAVDREPESEGGAETGTPDEPIALDPAELIAEARALDGSLGARADALAREAAARGSRGLVGGPGVSTDVIAPYARHTWELRFRGGEYAAIAIAGDGDTDLDCTVYNASGTAITGDYNYVDTCYVEWYVPYTQTYRFVVNNLGGYYNAYVIETN